MTSNELEQLDELGVAEGIAAEYTRIGLKVLVMCCRVVVLAIQSLTAAVNTNTKILSIKK